MYCVKCGVKLQEQVSECPLCGTPVWNPDGTNEENVSSYSDRMPQRKKRSRKPALILVSTVCAFVVVVESLICLLVYGGLNWSGYVTGGVIMVYILVVLPFWFEHPKAEFFIPFDHVAAAVLTFYICRKTGGHWALTFALPILAGSCIVILVSYCLFKYVRRRRLLILAGNCFFLGGYMILVEFLVSITFGTTMFTWCWFPFAGLAAVGVLFLLFGIIRPLREALEKYFFF